MSSSFFSFPFAFSGTISTACASLGVASPSASAAKGTQPLSIASASAAAIFRFMSYLFMEIPSVRHSPTALLHLITFYSIMQPRRDS